MALIMEFLEGQLVSNDVHFCDFISTANLSCHRRQEGKEDRGWGHSMQCVCTKKKRQPRCQAPHLGQ